MMRKSSDAINDFLLALFVASVMFSNSISADPVIQEKRVYYEFEASNRAQIWQQISQHSPKGNVTIAGNHAVNVAVTEWRLAGTYRLKPGLKRCQLVEVKPVLHITIRMPHWKNKWAADDKLVADWDRYVRMVSNHEDVHKQYAIAMVKEFYEKAQNLGEFRTCQDAMSGYEKLQQDTVSVYSAKNRSFDAQEFVYQKNLRWF